MSGMTCAEHPGEHCNILDGRRHCFVLGTYQYEHPPAERVVAVVLSKDASEEDRRAAKNSPLYNGQPAPFVLECNGEGDEVQINQAIQLAALDAELSRGVEWGGKP